MDTWFEYNQIFEEDKVPFSKLKITRLVKLLVVERVANRNPITTRSCLVETLTLALYPSNYKQDKNVKWIMLNFNA
jgi:hypothetical protein